MEARIEADTTIEYGRERREASPFFLGFLDFLLLCFCFHFLNFWKRGRFVLDPMYAKLLFVFVGIWLFVSLSTRKFKYCTYENYGCGMTALVKCNLYTAYLAALLVVLTGLYSYSRTHIFGTCALMFFLEASILSGYYIVARPGRIQADLSAKDKSGRGRYEKALVVFDFFIAGFSFMAVHYWREGAWDLSADYEKLFVVFYGLWFVFSLVTGKFEARRHRNYYHAVWPWVKSAVLIALGLAVVVFGLRLFHFSRTQVFGTVLLLLCLEIVFHRIRFVFKRGNEEGDIESADQVNRILKQQKLPLALDLDEIRNHFLEPVREKLRDKYLRDDRELFEFLDSRINLSDIVHAEMSLRSNDNMVYFDRMNGHPVRLFVNLHKVNDIRWMNRYFLEVHNMLLNGGYFVGIAHTIVTHRDWIYENFPRHLASAYYMVDFAIHRILPKLPWIKKLYFSFTKGKNRIVSRAEILGRLTFCGFNIVGETTVNKRLHFVAQKTMTPSVDQNPTYGPFVELKRIGLEGRPIVVYKLRTMHPYSEYLQDYVYKINGLKKGGKIENDFRITGWGKIARKLWLDELPMLYNWLKGDLQIVGVRPLSPHYFGLYPESLRELRKKVAPGLVPPFYVDMPNTFEEICESERRYIEAYLEAPIRTQVSYFCRAFCNIVFKGARSG